MNLESGAPPPTDHMDKAVIETLHGLIHICHDAYDGYMKAADGITSAAYKTMFAEYALQRGRFATQLGNLVEDHGGDPDDDGHAMNLFRRGWTNIMPVLMGGDYGAIFIECKRSEAMALKAYERIMELQVPKDVSELIEQQYQQIVEAHDRLDNLQEAYYLEHKN